MTAASDVAPDLEPTHRAFQSRRVRLSRTARCCNTRTRSYPLRLIGLGAALRVGAYAMLVAGVIAIVPGRPWRGPKSAKTGW